MIDTDTCQQILSKCLTWRVNTHSHEIAQKLQREQKVFLLQGEI